jgi:hypothetical protein
METYTDKEGNPKTNLSLIARTYILDEIGRNEELILIFGIRELRGLVA